MGFTLYLPYACLCAFDCLLSLRMPLCVSLSTFPVHACMHFTVRSPFARLYTFHSVLALRVPLCVLLRCLSAHASLHFRDCSRSCGDVLRVLFYLDAATLQLDPCGRSSADHEDMQGFTRRHSESDPTRTIPSATKISFCDRDDPRRGAGMLKIKKPSVCAQSALGPTAHRP